MRLRRERGLNTVKADTVADLHYQFTLQKITFADMRAAGVRDATSL